VVPFENLEEDSPIRDFERWMMGAPEMVSLSLKSLSGEGLEEGGGVPLLRTLEDMLRKAPDTDISLHRGPFTAKGNLVHGRGLVYQGL